MSEKIVAWGGYDITKPRVRLMLDALRRQGVLADEIRIPVWDGVRDKSVASKAALLAAGLRWLIGLPGAIWRLMRSPRGMAILLPYPGTPDIFLVAPLAKLTGRLIVLDAFLPVHDTIVGDRGMVRDGGLLSRFIRAYERAGLALADLIVTDTDAHGEFLAEEYAIPPKKFVTVLVGAEQLFSPANATGTVDDLVGPRADRLEVLFYGQFIPLHGLKTILDATRLVNCEDVRWIIVGQGQEEPLMRAFMETARSENVIWLQWVDYERLPSLIARADLCLGVFGASDKASRVIPNKLFQQLAVGKRVVTRQSPAVDGLAKRYPEAIVTVPPDDPASLGRAVERLLRTQAPSGSLPAEALRQIGPDSGVSRLVAALERVSAQG